MSDPHEVLRDPTGVRRPIVEDVPWVPRALVIGGARGIGRATVLRLAQRGSPVALAYHENLARAEETAKAAMAVGATVTVLQGDIASEAERLVSEAAAALGALDLIVVTAVPVITGRSASVTHEQFVRAMDVVVWGVHQAVVAARPHLAASGGSAVAVSSLGAWQYAGYYGALGPAKAALESTVRYLAAELGRDGVRVNAVSPSLIDDLQHLDAAPDVAAFMEATAKRTPLRRLATPDDVARTVLSLASPECAFVTGEVLRVDGGYSLLA